jgi:RNA polymerase sigma-70 factor (ECF subfamily)
MAWLFSVARNEWRSHRRWEHVDLSRLLALHVTVSSGAPPSGEDQLRDVAKALDRLSDSDREVLLLVAVEELESRETAKILGISYEAFRQRLARARTRLEQHLREGEK